MEFLAVEERQSGSISNLIGKEFFITQPAVSQHLKVLRDNGLVSVKKKGARRIYKVDEDPLREIDDWLDKFRKFWEPKLDALAEEIARGKK